MKAGPDKTKRWKQIFKLHAEALHDSSGNYRKQVAENLLRDAISPYDLPEKAVGVNVCAVEGNTNLGGHDFTRALMSVVLQKLRPRMSRQYPGLSNKEMDRLLFDDAFQTELTRKCDTAKMELSLKNETHVLFRLCALKQVPSKSSVSKILKELLDNPRSKRSRLITQVSKVNSSNGQIRAINLKLRKSMDASRGTETYTLEWPSRQLFRNCHIIDLSMVCALGTLCGCRVSFVSLQLIYTTITNQSNSHNRFRSRKRCTRCDARDSSRSNETSKTSKLFLDSILTTGRYEKNPMLLCKGILYCKGLDDSIAGASRFHFRSTTQRRVKIFL